MSTLAANALEGARYFGKRAKVILYIAFCGLEHGFISKSGFELSFGCWWTRLFVTANLHGVFKFYERGPHVLASIVSACADIVYYLRSTEKP